MRRFVPVSSLAVVVLSACSSADPGQAVGGQQSAAQQAPSNPSSSLPPDPDFNGVCNAEAYDDSSACIDAAAAAIAHGRAREGLPPMVLPDDFAQLSAREQVYVATNLERTVRGLPPMKGLATALDSIAGQAAQKDRDPSGVPSGWAWTLAGGNWAGGVGNPLEAVYSWMYDDGPGSDNEDCTSSNKSGCWGHRDNILASYACSPCVMGAGFALAYPDGVVNDAPSYAEFLVGLTSGSPALDYSWNQVTLPPSSCGLLEPGQGLLSGQSVTSCGGKYEFVVQGSDGNVVEYEAGKALWAAKTTGHAGDRILMQDDGNLVVYLGTTPLWASGTSGHPGAHFAVQTDGNLVVYEGTKPLWARFGL